MPRQAPHATCQNVNFLGHAHVALWRDTDAGYVLGAMLPDFASMARLRLGEQPDARIAAGVALHHTTDDVFHSLPAFRELMAETIDALQGSGVSRGAARAVGHIGVELLLDGELVDTPKLEHSYLDALHHGRGAAPVGLQDADAAGRLESLCERLIDWGLPRDYADPDAVTERLVRILAGRPRLRIEADQRPSVCSTLRRIQPRVRARRDEVLQGLRQALNTRTP